MLNITTPTSLTAEELEALTDFVFRINASEGSAYCSNKRSIIREELAEHAKNGCLAVCGELPDALTGAAFCFYSEEHHMADFSILIAPEADYMQAADGMFKAISENLPKETQCNFFFPKQNRRCAAFLEAMHAKREVNEYGLLLLRGQERNLAATEGIAELAQEDAAEFAALHDAVFPEVYISGKEILAAIGKDRKVYVLKKDGKPLAYGVLQRRSETRSAAEIIGVREGYRHQGYGRRILSELIRRGFADEKTEKLDLIVDCDNENAMKLYFDLGFETEFENCCYTIQL